MLKREEILSNQDELKTYTQDAIRGLVDSAGKQDIPGVIVSQLILNQIFRHLGVSTLIKEKEEKDIVNHIDGVGLQPDSQTHYRNIEAQSRDLIASFHREPGNHISWINMYSPSCEIRISFDKVNKKPTFTDNLDDEDNVGAITFLNTIAQSIPVSI